MDLSWTRVSMRDADDAPPETVSALDAGEIDAFYEILLADSIEYDRGHDHHHAGSHHQVVLVRFLASEEHHAQRQCEAVIRLQIDQRPLKVVPVTIRVPYATTRR